MKAPADIALAPPRLEYAGTATPQITKTSHGAAPPPGCTLCQAIQRIFTGDNDRDTERPKLSVSSTGEKEAGQDEPNPAIPLVPGAVGIFGSWLGSTGEPDSVCRRSTISVINVVM